jgi:hypothetical protein
MCHKQKCDSCVLDIPRYMEIRKDVGTHVLFGTNKAIMSADSYSVATQLTKSRQTLGRSLTMNTFLSIGWA